MAIRKIVSRSIGTDVIAAEDLAANSITVAEIQDGAVTDAKIASGVTASKLSGALPAIDGSSLTGVDPADGSISTAKLADDAVTADKLNVGQIGGRRNLIINGAMQVAQRGNTTNDNGVFVADRFQFRTSGLGAAGAVIAASTQSTVVPSGFASALKTNVTTAGSGFSADNRDGFATKIEHQDIAHLLDAGNSFTLSFWVRSSLATTYGLTITVFDRDTTSTGDQYATSYDINAVDTWEKKTITIPATTSSRSGGSDNAVGMHIYWNLEMISGGSRSSATANAWADNATSDQVVSSAADTGWMSSTNDFYITGVQLEVGTAATPFEHRSYGEELTLCQRYCQVLHKGVTTNLGIGYFYDTNYFRAAYTYPTTMRATPSVTIDSATDLFRILRQGTSITMNTLNKTQISRTNVILYQSGVSGASGVGCELYINGTYDPYIYIEAEL